MVNTHVEITPIGAGGADSDLMAGGRFKVQLAVDGHTPGVGVDGESAAPFVVQAVGNRVGGGVGIRGQDRSVRTVETNGRMLGHGVCRGVGIGNVARVELVHVANGYPQCLAIGEDAIRYADGHFIDSIQVSISRMLPIAA